MSNIIKFIRGAEADIPVLNQGEPAFTTDTHKVFIGDGAANHQLAMITDISDIDKTNWVYPQDYATGTGTLGDPWANNCINSAYTACPTGGTIFLRAGYYTLSTLLYIDKKINIIGEGINKTIIVMGVTTTNAIYMEAQDYVTLQGFTIDGDSQTASSSLISIHAGCSYITVKDVEVKNGYGSGIQYYESNYSTFKNIYSHNNGNVGLYSISNKSVGNKNNLYRDIYCWDNVDV